LKLIKKLENPRYIYIYRFLYDSKNCYRYWAVPQPAVVCMKNAMRFCGSLGDGTKSQIVLEQLATQARTNELNRIKDLTFFHLYFLCCTQLFYVTNSELGKGGNNNYELKLHCKTNQNDGRLIFQILINNKIREV